jgi:hypothetical protein
LSYISRIDLLALLGNEKNAEGYCWSRTSERQVLRIRYLYLQAILRQEAGFFDSQEATTSEIINSISKDASHIQEVLSEKVGTQPNKPLPPPIHESSTKDPAPNLQSEQPQKQNKTK